MLPPSSRLVVPSQLPQPQMMMQVVINMTRTTCSLYLALVGPAPLQTQGAGAAWWGSARVMGGVHGSANPGTDNIRTWIRQWGKSGNASDCTACLTPISCLYQHLAPRSPHPTNTKHQLPVGEKEAMVHPWTVYQRGETI
jgi:hypothetical protein